MSNDRRTILLPAAGSTALATDFPVLDETDLLVRRTRALLQTTLVLDTDYTLSGIGNEAGCFVTLTAASLADDIFQLDGDSQADRISDYDPEQTPSGDQLDQDLNRLIHLAQEARRDIEQLLLNAGAAPQIELSVQGGNIAWRPVGGPTWFALAGLTYPAHSHVIADTAGLQAVLDSKLPTASFTGHVHADVVAAGASGFMTGGDKTKLNGLRSEKASHYALISQDLSGAEAIFDLSAYPDFRDFYIELSGVKLSATTELRAQFRNTANGAAYLSALNYFNFANGANNISAVSINNTSAANWKLTNTDQINTRSGSFTIMVRNPAQVAELPLIRTSCEYFTAAATITLLNGSGFYNAASDITHIRVYPAAGTFAADGKATLIGVLYP